MSVSVKSAKEIELMREAGRLLEIVHDELAKMIRPGISTLDIDREGEKIIRSFGCIPNFLHYNGYPARACISVTRLTDVTGLTMGAESNSSSSLA